MSHSNDIWIFGDWRNYFQNRVTLQLIAKARELAQPTGGRVCVLVFGHKAAEWVGEYTAHGADQIYLYDHKSLAKYKIETYTWLLANLAQDKKPGAILVGATGFGKELAARAAMILKTGLTADCVDLSWDQEGRLLMTAPAFGGNLLAQVINPERLPAMATVRAGCFSELPHDGEREAVVEELALPKDLPAERMRLVASRRVPERAQSLENADVVIAGGRGMGSKRKFKNLYELARLLGGEVGATRPVVYSGWAEEDSLIGQAGKTVKPKVLFSFGCSGAIQHTAGIAEAGLIVAVNKNPNATMMQIADVGLVGDANQICLAMIKELKERQGQ